MLFCHRCGKELADGVAFCSACGAAQRQQAHQPTYAAPTRDPQAEEQEFLEWTHRLLRWERKAWSITGKFYLIFGCIFAGIFGLIGLGFMAYGDYATEALGVFYTMYSFFLGALFIGFGVVNLKCANKIPFYIENLYVNFRYAADRCGSVGMLVLTVIFGTVSPVFFIVNFCRMKAGKQVIDRIIARQQQF